MEKYSIRNTNDHTIEFNEIQPNDYYPTNLYQSNAFMKPKQTFYQEEEEPKEERQSLGGVSYKSVDTRYGLVVKVRERNNQ